jgi:hypothetical protein
VFVYNRMSYVSVSVTGLVDGRCYRGREIDDSGVEREFYLGRFQGQDIHDGSYQFENRYYESDDLDLVTEYFRESPCISNSAASAGIPVVHEDPVNFQEYVDPQHYPFTRATNNPNPVATNMLRSAGGGVATGGGAANYSALVATSGGGAIATSGMSNDPLPVGTIVAPAAQQAAPTQQARSMFGCPKRGGGCTISRKTRRKRNRRNRKSRHRRRM